MKKHDCSVIGFSEIENITTDYKKIKNTSDKLKMLGIIMADGGVNIDRIKQIVSDISISFFSKLKRKFIHREGGISEVFLNYSMMVERAEYIGAYFYLAFLYGFWQWNIPKEITLMPADDNVLKCFIVEFGKRFSLQIENMLCLSGDNREVEQ